MEGKREGMEKQGEGRGGEGGRLTLVLLHAGLIGRGDTGWNDGISGSVLGAPWNDVKTLWREGGREGGRKWNSK